MTALATAFSASVTVVSVVAVGLLKAGGFIISGLGLVFGYVLAVAAWPVRAVISAVLVLLSPVTYAVSFALIPVFYSVRAMARLEVSVPQTCPVPQMGHNLRSSLGFMVNVFMLTEYLLGN